MANGRSPRSARRLAIGCVVAAIALVIASCGSHKKTTPTTRSSSNTVDIYSSLPLLGPSSSQATPLLKGIRLALAQAGYRAGQFAVAFKSLDDATPAAGGWDAVQTAANAREAAFDPKTVYYIGEFNSAASEISAPILNEAGVAQVSPASTYVGLTGSIPGLTAPGEPQKYAPTGKPTFLRIVPTDSVQAAADLEAMKQAGCKRVAVANDEELYGTSLAALIRLEASYYGIDIVSYAGIDPTAPDFRAYAAAIKDLRADCFEFAGTIGNGGVQITRAVNAALPNARIFGPDALCTSLWTNSADGGVPPSIDPKIECTVATPNLDASSQGRTFLAAYSRAYGVSTPDPYAAIGYEAMELGLDTIAGLGSNGNNKLDVLKALVATKNRHSVLGVYGFDPSGDTTLKSYGLYKVGPNGGLVFYRTLTPTKVLKASS
jgi:branched-chain amino acid transport system substrate-binding protein